MNAQAPTIAAAAEITDHLAGFLKAAGDPLRLQVLQVLGQSSFGVLELCDIMAMKQSGMSHHLKVLAQGGLVEKRREGNSIFYRRRLPQADSAEGALHGALLDELDDSELNSEVAARLEQVQNQRAEQSRAFFARHAEHLDEQQELIADYDQYAEQAAELLLRACPNGENALEIGPGDGQFLAELASHFQQVVGLDNAEAMLAVARQTVAKRSNVQLILGDWPATANTLATVDAVVLNMVLHHLPSPASAIRAAARQLNEGGTLLITDLCPHDQHWAHEACGDVWLGFEEADLVNWAGRAGLELQETQFLALRNGFQVQVRTFRKNGQ
ncbi:metalloregulator ArsR/SmtB family transcription factor [Alcanivorax sp. S6407]|uniref:ArsR/SmtB family transcription factor n=1 Tax=Alcanivorax sp. S6407 TaxID=2926424 RepID=UPI001FF63022|nr:metalloregulator ArsR/SmtB family transcription factor [Alcanivorax sp. S6407]MCK0154269.1 metalloregulator ArsR/SmtB family transcription factor [Alcanivorax sp. S6407]